MKEFSREVLKSGDGGGKFDGMNSRVNQKLSDLPTAGQIRNNIWGAAAAVLGIILAALAFGGDRFDGGLGASSLLHEQAEQQAQKDADQDGRLALIDQKLDILIKQTSGK